MEFQDGLEGSSGANSKLSVESDPSRDAVPVGLGSGQTASVVIGDILDSVVSSGRERGRSRGGEWVLF